MASNLVPLRNAEHHTTHNGCYRPLAVAARSALQGNLPCQLEVVDGEKVALLLCSYAHCEEQQQQQGRVAAEGAGCCCWHRSRARGGGGGTS